MTLRSGTILGAVATCLEAMATTTDAGAPTKFHESPTDVDSSAARDRAFWIEGVTMDTRNVDGVGGRVDRTMRFTVRVKYVNERAKSSVYEAIIAQDVSRIQDRVPVYCRTNVTGCDGMETDGESRHEISEGSRIHFVTIPFRAEFYDDEVTS
jgi:hypothetical protein